MFGGVTEHMLFKPDLPTLMLHLTAIDCGANTKRGRAAANVLVRRR
jgi:hypothetical protein